MKRFAAGLVVSAIVLTGCWGGVKGLPGPGHVDRSTQVYRDSNYRPFLYN